MKNIFFIYLGCIFLIITCRMPSDPLGKISIIKKLPTINTGGKCLDIDVDIEDSILVAAANYNGYFVYKINLIGGIVSDLSEQKHVGVDEMDTNLGDNRGQSVLLSKEHNIAFIMDQYDHIWLYKYEEGATQYGPPNYLEEDCYGSTWLSVAIDDQEDKIGIYTLLKHNAAEEEVGAFDEYSTSLVWTSLKGIDPSSISLDQDEPNCEYIRNQGSVAEKIYFANGLLSQAYGELGVRVFQKTDKDICLINGDPADIADSLQCDLHEFPPANANAGMNDYKSCCENLPCQGLDNCENNITYINNNGYPGFGGLFSSAGGIIPQIYAEFDTPGEVDAIYSTGNTIFSGLSNSNGCLLTTLGTDASITGSFQFAIGYSIRGIHENRGLLALAAGHDGILLYNWNGLDASFLGKIETSYANNVKVSNNIIFAATEEGIEVIQIDR